MTASISSIQFIAKLADPSCNTPRAARRVVFNADVLKSAKIYAGDVVAIALASNESKPKFYSVGIAWPSLRVPSNSVVVSTSLLLTARLVDGATVQVFPLPGGASTNGPPGLPSLHQVRDASVIHLKEISDTNLIAAPDMKSNDRLKNRNWLPLLLRESLVELKYITPSQIIEAIYEGVTRRFCVVSLSQSPETETVTSLARSFQTLSVDSHSQLWTVGWDSSVSIVQNQTDSTAVADPKLGVEVVTQQPGPDAFASVGGMDKEISQIRDLLEIPMTHPELFRHFALKPPRGILLHGPPGTGKTHLARAIASSTRASVLIINGPELSSAYHGETESKLRDVFKEAHEKSPCIVVLDEIDALVPRREDGAGGEVEKRVVATLLTILDGMEEDTGSGRVVVIGTTNRPNAIDAALRRPGRFDKEIEIGIPDTDARLSILNVLLSKTPHSISQEDLCSLASRAHGYVGADLSAVVREAGTLAIKRWLANNSSSPPSAGSPSPSPQLTLTMADLQASLPSVRPSALRSLFFETPPIKYSDIGGQKNVIQKLREAVEWPLLHPEVFERLGVRPPKGVLLYGPPGCSKTVLARACACESGVNFVAVKGPELLNKFVGESERALREIFRKARAASPSIIFFDEIDALATSRVAGTASHEGVLTSLLNEMDGVQELLRVTVVAATNRPDVLDPALLRPGRFDRLLYVGPPDQLAREEILKIRMKKMSIGQDVNVEEIAKMTEGCSGAEVVSLCQEAAILTMQKDMNSSHVSQDVFITAAKAIKKQITPTVIQTFEQWAEKNGFSSQGL